MKNRKPRRSGKPSLQSRETPAQRNRRQFNILMGKLREANFRIGQWFQTLPLIAQRAETEYQPLLDTLYKKEVELFHVFDAATRDPQIDEKELRKLQYIICKMAPVILHADLSGRVQRIYEMHHRLLHDPFIPENLEEFKAFMKVPLETGFKDDDSEPEEPFLIGEDALSELGLAFPPEDDAPETDDENEYLRDLIEDHIEDHIEHVDVAYSELDTLDDSEVRDAIKIARRMLDEAEEELDELELRAHMQWNINTRVSKRIAPNMLLSRLEKDTEDLRRSLASAEKFKQEFQDIAVLKGYLKTYHPNYHSSAKR